MIPAYNGEKFLKLAIEAALAQTRMADEVIVIDDASTDRSASIAQAFGDKIKYFYHSKATGFVDAWNRAAGKASCDFVTILHQDDLLHQDYLMHIEKAISRYPNVRHFYAACNYIDEHGTVTQLAPEPHSMEPVLYTGKEYAHNYLNGVLTNRHIHRCPGVTTTRNLLLNECSYRKEAGHIADDDFFLRVGAFTDVVGISQPLASYRHHRESETSKLNSLTHSLARDYLYQVKYYKAGSSLLDQQDVTKINSQAVKFINLLLFQALRDREAENTGGAFQLKKELEILLPGFTKKTLPAWGRIMWEMGSPEGSNFIARQYVNLLALAINARNFAKKVLR